MTRAQAPFGKVFIRTYGAFLATATLRGVIMAAGSLDPMTILVFTAYAFFYGLVMGAFAAPVIGGLWLVVRRKTGEGLPPCLMFGLLPGFAAASLFTSLKFEPLVFAIFVALGAFGGWLYWLLARRGLRRPMAPSACPMEKLFD